MSDMRVIQPIDYTNIPDKYDGKWILVRKPGEGGEQRVIGSGLTPKEAMEDAGVGPDEPDIVMTTFSLNPMDPITAAMDECWRLRSLLVHHVCTCCIEALDPMQHDESGCDYRRAMTAEGFRR